MSLSVAIVDYGSGNLKSVARAIEYVGGVSYLASTAEDIQRADRLLLPGVGAFDDGMKCLQECGLADPIRDYAESGRHLLGICLGMQLLFTQSDEHGHSEGLNIIAGRVEAIPNAYGNGIRRKTPHIGWAELLSYQGAEDPGLLMGLSEHAAAYFVHSYHCLPTASNVLLAECEYEGLRICATVRQGNVYGCQFHPEKSGEVGLKIVSNFIRLS